MRSGDVNVGTGPGNSHWCTKDLSKCTMCTGKFEEAQGYTGKLEEVRGKLSGSSIEIMFLNASLSAGGILYRHLVQPPKYLTGHPNICPAILLRGRRARDPEIRHWHSPRGPLLSKSEGGPPMAIYTVVTFVGSPTYRYTRKGRLTAAYVDWAWPRPAYWLIHWQWTFWVLTVWSALMITGIYFFVPGTYHLVLLRNRVIATHKLTGDPQYRAEIRETSCPIAHTTLWSCTRPSQLLVCEPMLFLCIFTALSLAYVPFSAIPLDFSNVYHFPCNRLAGPSLGSLSG